MFLHDFFISSTIFLIDELYYIALYRKETCNLFLYTLTRYYGKAIKP